MVSGDRQAVLGERGPFDVLQRHFSRHFERIDVLCPRPPRPPSVSVIHERVHLHPAPVGRARMVGWIARAGEQLIRAHGHALITSHDYGWFYNGLGSARLAARTGVPYVSEIHHVPGHPVAIGVRERFDRAVARAYVRWARSRALAFRVVNEVEMPDLLASWGVPRQMIQVLPSLYIDLEAFRPASAPGPFEQDVTFVGRMVANKGLERIVDALALLGSPGGGQGARQPGGPGRGPSALFVGRGPLAARVRARAAERGVRARFVEWVGPQPELAEIYRRSRVVVCASTCEGGPRFTVEALACGTPVVSTRVGIMNELLADGTAGRLVDFDAASLAEGIREVLADEPRRRALGAAGVAIARRFEMKAVIARYAEGLAELARRGRAGR
jgi:glycosyltransferase involved in cell wall biosynthesis